MGVQVFDEAKIYKSTSLLSLSCFTQQKAHSAALEKNDSHFCGIKN